jgi:outer membrane lipoprotein-sorting protein
MKNLLLVCFTVLILPVFAQSSSGLLQQVNTKFSTVKTYSAALNLNFDIPGVKVDAINGQVFYKAPKKFRIKTKGIIFLPKQNPYEAILLLSDSNSYVAVKMADEIISNVKTTVINVLPNKQADFIVGKFWIDPVNKLVLKSEITTQANGTLITNYTYGTMAKNALPDKMELTFDVAKFKVPKAVAVDINSKTKATDNKNKGTGNVKFTFTNYVVNKNIDDKVFTE